MKIAVIAWGSLIWDARDLAITSDFEPNGPRLLIEFSRISGDGRLTLVIDEEQGVDCVTYCATCLLGDLGAAIENLRVREGMPGPKGVGFVDIASEKCSDRAVKRHPKAVARIKAWAKSGDYDAVIWTALASNFHEQEKASEPFSVEAAVRYLGHLDAAVLKGALNYMRQAPPEVQTPVRAAVRARWPEK